MDLQLADPVAAVALQLEAVVLEQQDRALLAVVQISLAEQALSTMVVAVAREATEQPQIPRRL
jgi:hypothetical protein